MSSPSSQVNSNEDSQVMVRQVNLAAAFHDHISCTKISQHSMATSICGLQTSVADMNDPQNAAIDSIGSEQSVAFESDHMYATENKSFKDNNGLTTNGCVVRPNSLFNNSLSEERNQISKLTEMILGQLDLIQHQQEQLLKKDRQLQGLKQDREALCLRLEKMEKRIAVLTAKVANNTNNNYTNAINNNNTISNNINNICINNSLNNNIIQNLSRNCVNNSQTSNTSNIAVETDCDQSGSDTIIEDNNSAIGLFTDPTAFTKLYSNVCNSSAVKSTINSNLNNVDNALTSGSNSSSESTAVNDTTSEEYSNSLTAIKIKSEPQEDSECDPSIDETTAPKPVSCVSARKHRKRQSEVLTTPTTTSTTSLRPTTTANKKRTKTAVNTTNSCEVNATEVKKEILSSSKETSNDSSFSTCLSALQSNKTYSNCSNNKKKVVKQKSETSSRLLAVDTSNTASNSSSLNCRISSVTRDVLTTSQPYSIVVNSDYIPIEICVNNSNTNDTIAEKREIAISSQSVEDNNSRTTNDVPNSDEIEVPNWRLHPVSSCYSLEGTENLDDEVFNRRHLKLENDERRRKRWDIQRLREQRQNEKLRTGRYYSSSLGNYFIDKPSDLKKKNYEFVSFYPDIKSLQSIEVTEKIPYIAFGHPIPKLPAKCFSLPWNACERHQNAVKARITAQKK